MILQCNLEVKAKVRQETDNLLSFLNLKVYCIKHFKVPLGRFSSVAAVPYLKEQARVLSSSEHPDSGLCPSHDFC